MDINNNKIFKYIYELSDSDYVSNLKRFMSEHDDASEDRFAKLDMFRKLRGKCRKPVILSKTFISAMDKSGVKFTKFHREILETLDGECGVIRSPYFIEGTYLFYMIDGGILHCWISYTHLSKDMPIITYYIGGYPKDEIDGGEHETEFEVCQMFDMLQEVNLHDYVYTVFDYLCMREFADVEIKEVTTMVKREIKKGKKKIQVTEEGLSYYLFDSKWYVELCNNNDFLVSGHFRLQPYANGKKKLIWINEFTKHGYHRKAAIDKVKDGDIVLD